MQFRVVREWLMNGSPLVVSAGVDGAGSARPGDQEGCGTERGGTGRTGRSKGWGSNAWRTVFLLSAWGVGACSMGVLFGSRPGGAKWWLAGAAGLGVSLLAGGYFRLALTELLNEFTYREKFALFMGHVLLLVLPALIWRGNWMDAGLTLVLISLGLQLITATTAHRFLAVSGAMAVAGLWRRPAGEIAWALAWLAGAGVYCLTQRVRFALEDHRTKRFRIAPGVVAGLGLLSVVLPLVMALGLYWALPSPPARVAGPGRGMVDEGPEAGRRGRVDREVDLKEMVWQAMGLAAGLAILIGVLHWYAQRRGKKAVRPPTEEELLVEAESVEAAPGEVGPPLDPLDGDTPRLRILRVFRRLESGLGRMGLGRHRQETVREYACGRVGGAVGLGGDAGGGDGTRGAVRRHGSLEEVTDLFERARYGAEEMSAEEAHRFEECAEDVLRGVRSGGGVGGAGEDAGGKGDGGAL